MGRAVSAVLSVVTVSVNPSLQSPDSMARYFKETDIDEFRECFYLYARSGQISTMDELTVIMRSLGMSPTITELKSYMRDKGGKISFADFLEIMHGHSKKESIPRELLEAFRGMDPQRKGYIPAKVVEYMPLGALLDLPLLRICG